MLNDINSMHAELCQTSMMLEEISLDMRFFGERISLTLSPIGTSTRAQWKSYENLPQARKENISVLECKISGVFRKVYDGPGRVVIGNTDDSQWLSINQSIETGQHNKFGKLVKSWTTDRCHSKIQRLLVNITSFINCEIRDNIKLIRGGWDSAAFSAREIATALEIAAMDLLRGRAMYVISLLPAIRSKFVIHTSQITMIHSWAWVHFSPMT
ncbi:hypothetical protein SISSUDRAFT_562144 [Sistotremastrum suecicum HHB10207 ss-3]|uniref:Uncharacterized protein n=1 Tax=Sistotremastrum suecicum HHB10207 ss-3 TaxID=1314776 RepID=A0A166ESR6_9AGAM|nr:hypothetical protein SISSUDRAFT_562144 [Sistotremastrum suecicum HHB10207 ss-3]